MPRPLLITLTLGAAAAVWLPGAAGAEPSPRAAASAVRNCPDVSVGYTMASLSVRATTCRTGRRVVKRWLAKDFGNGPPPRVSYVGYWACYFGGRDYTVTLRCRRGARAVRAVWGD